MCAYYFKCIGNEDKETEMQAVKALERYKHEGMTLAACYLSLYYLKQDNTIKQGISILENLTEQIEGNSSLEYARALKISGVLDILHDLAEIKNVDLAANMLAGIYLSVPGLKSNTYAVSSLSLAASNT